MKKENQTQETCCKDYMFKKHHHHHHHSGGSNAIYGLGIIGALFYFLQNATSFSAIIIGIGKSIFWPAVLIFRILTDLKI